MPYTVVFGAMDDLENDGERIRFVTSPQEGAIGVEMLRVLAKEEEDELPVAVHQ